LLESRVVAYGGEVVVSTRLLTEGRVQLHRPSQVGERFVAGVARERREARVVVMQARMLRHVHFPHVENPDLPTNTMAAAERWAADLSGPAYAIDDETAIKVVDGTVEVVSEGNWKLFTP
jgi:hypothetical protein